MLHVARQSCRLTVFGDVKKKHPPHTLKCSNMVQLPRRRNAFFMPFIISTCLVFGNQTIQF
jgi:hypothetical protein